MELAKRIDETDEEFKLRVFLEKRKNPSMTWDDVAVVVNHELNQNSSSNKYRKEFNKKFRSYILKDCGIDDVEDGQSDAEILLQSVTKQLESIRKEKTVLNDIRRDANAQLRAFDRIEYMRQISHEFAEEMAKHLDDYKFDSYVTNKLKDEYKEGILLIGDWHFGIEIDEYLNNYNPSVAKERLQNVLNACIERAYKEGIKVINVLNLGDLISGRIHSQLRMQSRMDAVHQTHEVEHLLVNFLMKLSEHFQVEYWDCLDNHSRVEPNKKESLQLESFAKQIHWYVEDIFNLVKTKHPITVHENRSDDIIVAHICGHRIVGVHGDKDDPKNIVRKMSAFLSKRPDVLAMAHRHHFMAEEQNRCMVICNPSLMGSDQYALDGRLESAPAQLFIVATKDNPVENIYRLLAD